VDNEYELIYLNEEHLIDTPEAEANNRPSWMRTQFTIGSITLFCLFHNLKVNTKIKSHFFQLNEK